MNTIKHKAFLFTAHVTTYFSWWLWVAATYVPVEAHYWFW
jgi:hypothetical protein